MRQLILVSFAIVSLTLPLSGCGDMTGPCIPAGTTPGKATIVSAEPAPMDESNCATEPIKVVFNFTPDDASKADLAQEGLVLTIGGGYNPPGAWVESSGLTVGSVHSAVLEEIAGGSCAPINVSLTDVDTSAAMEDCF